MTKVSPRPGAVYLNLFCHRLPREKKTEVDSAAKFENINICFSLDYPGHCSIKACSIAS